jgi:hypothetical protein
MNITNFKDALHYFYDPYSQSTNLNFDESVPGNPCVFSEAGHKIDVLENIIIFSAPENLGTEQLREMLAYDQIIEREDLSIRINKSRGNEYYNHFCQAKITPLVNYLFQNSCEQCVFLGAGTGYEIKLILERDKQNKIKFILASDISINAVKTIPYQLAKYDINLTLFTADIDYCPIKNKDINLILCDALHHTPDMHASIERLLAYGYKNIYFVEPAGNILIKILEKFGLARRVEESGLKPGRLDIQKVKRLASKYNYKADITTFWVFPEDYYRRIFGYNLSLQKKVLAGVNVVSHLLNYATFGNSATVHLEQKR